MQVTNNLVYFWLDIIDYDSVFITDLVFFLHVWLLLL